MRGWGAHLLVWLMALLAAPALAMGSGHEAVLQATSACHATASFDEPLDAVVTAGGRWRCGGGEPSLAADRALLRFLATGDHPYVHFGTRPSQFEGLTLLVVRDGQIRGQSYRRSTDIMAGPQGRMFLVDLPVPVASGDMVVAVLDRPTTRGLFSDARIYTGDPTAGHKAMSGLLLAGIVCGMLIMPLAFNAAYYRVLRERFVLWHLAVTVGLLAQCLLTSGLIGHFVDYTVAVHAKLATLSFGMSVAAAAAFSAAFIEPNKLHPRLRKWLYIAAFQVLAVSVIHAFLPNLLRAVHTPFYYASFIPVLVLFLWAMSDAVRRRSRAVRYQIIGWSPFLIMGMIRIVTMLTPTVAQNEAVGLFYLAMVIESIATSLGVADRFMIIRRQRDKALSRASSLEALSERDDLTGLYNRRALDGKLGNFPIQGFTGFALFDLDNFKRVNDTHGHAVGDAVLRTVASVLDGHEGAVAVRMGGEEFLLLLRGDGVEERVERLREAIPVRIAREVAELEALVTASAGLVVWPAGREAGTDFVTLYRTADDLLYEAKHNGRNLLAAVNLEQMKAPDPGSEVVALEK